MNSETNQPIAENLQNNPESLWGPKRHEYIAMQADKRLTAKAKDAIGEILKPIKQSSLGEIANWADVIKGGGYKDDAETQQFLKEFPNMVHKQWHFVDLPLGVTSYDSKKYSPFVNETDVVQMIAKCVRVLQGNLEIMSKVNALRWLAHLIGDLHQPLHVGCTYIDFGAENPELISDPEEIIKKSLTKSSDHGGNLLILPLDGDVTLHSYWDSKIPSSPPSVTTISEIKINIPDGSPDKWGEVWAFDTVLKSRIAYQPLKIAGKVGKKFRLAWESKEAYDKICAPIVTEQLALGSERLAALVNRIFQ